MNFIASSSKQEIIPLGRLLDEGKTIDEIFKIIRSQDRENPVYVMSQGSINGIGYWIMGKERNEEALRLFKFNIELYPDAYNTYNSYGECLLKMGDTINAIKVYEKSLELNPDDQSGIEVLSQHRV